MYSYKVQAMTDC